MAASGLVLIDGFIPAWEAGEVHRIEVEAPAEAAYRALRSLDLVRSPLIRLLFRLRGLPTSRPLTLGALGAVGFVELGEEEGRELVLGITGRFWRPTGGLRRVPAADFATFAEPGYAKAAWNFTVEPVGDLRCVVATETRVATTDPGASRAFRFYWFLVGPFSSLIRRRVLALIKREAERR